MYILVRIFCVLDCCARVSLWLFFAHNLAIGVLTARKVFSKLLICMPLSCCSAIVLVVGECRHAFSLTFVSVVDPLYLDIIN